MTRTEILKRAVSMMDGAHPDIYDMLAYVARQSLSGAEVDTLHALINAGPVWDGDLPSKAGRNNLVDLGLATKCVCKGQQGFQVATYRGWNVFFAKLDSETDGMPMAATRSTDEAPTRP